MANSRKGWDQLSPAYRQRLQRHNVTREQYERYESIQSARGHSRTPERLSGYVKRARNLGVEYVAPEFTDEIQEMNLEDRIALSKDFVQGFMTPGHPRKGTKIWYQRREARIRFESWLLDVRGGVFSREDWRAYRALYLSHFGGAKA